MECYFWCSSGAGVQLYFTLLWRCTKRQLWVERLAHLPRTAPQQNLGRKIRKEKHERVRNGEREKRQIPSQSGSATVKDNFLSSSSCTNATEPTADVNSTSLTLSSQVLSVSRDLEPLRPTSAHFVWAVNTWAFLTDQRASAETVCCLLDNRESICECCGVGLWELRGRPGRRVMWIF